MTAELALVLSELERFATRAIDPRAARSEHPMSAAEVDALLDELRALGVVATDAASGLGLWEGDDGDALVASVRILRRLARANAGVALAAHLESLAQRIARALGLERSGAGVAVVHGRIGVGRGALARWLCDVAPDASDRAILEDVYAPSAPRLVTTTASFSWAITPAIDARGALGWSKVPRDRADVVVLPRAHGFDELATLTLRPKAEIAGAGDRALFADALVRSSLGYVAIALGALDRGHALARSFAANRRQGGAVIDRHAAVQLLLASARGAIDAVESQLEWLAREAARDDAVRRALALRAEAHPLLSRGANDGLQVFGGLGYMRDTGLEKVLRDVVHLRATGAGPTELALVAAEWERARA